MCAVISHLQPEDAIVVDESLTSGGAYWDLSKVPLSEACLRSDCYTFARTVNATMLLRQHAYLACYAQTPKKRKKEKLTGFCQPTRLITD